MATSGEVPELSIVTPKPPETIGERFLNFLKSYYTPEEGYKYRARIARLIAENSKSLVVDFPDLLTYDSSLAELIVEKPLEVIPVISEALREAIRIEDSEYAQKHKKFNVRFRRLPEVVSIRRLRAHHIDKLIMVEGIVTRATPVKHQLIKAIFRCKACGTEIEVPQVAAHFVTPTKCPNETCPNRKGPFELIEEKCEYIDWQKIVIQEKPEDLPPGQLPRSLEAILIDDLVDTVKPGDRVVAVGVLRIQQESLKKSKPPVFSAYLDINYIEAQTKEFAEVEITPEDEKKILELAKDPRIKERIVKSIAPSIHGMRPIKEAIACLLFGGVPKVYPDGVRVRGDIHILLVGDPGTGKSLTYSVPVLYYEPGKGLQFRPIGEIVDTLIEQYRNRVKVEGESEILYLRDVGVEIYVPSVNPEDFTVEWKKVRAVIRHRAPEKVVLVKTKTGRTIVVTKDHSILVFNGSKLTVARAQDLTPGKSVVPVLKKILPVGTRDLVELRTTQSDCECDCVEVKSSGCEKSVRIQKLTELVENEYLGWDFVAEIKEVNVSEVEPEHSEYVYDLSVEDYENFVAGYGLIFVHNSQLLKFVARVAPRGVYTTGKGSTAAGLCVLPDTYIVLSDGRIVQICEVVDSVLSNLNESVPLVTKIAGLNEESLKVQYLETSHAWKLEVGEIAVLKTGSGITIGLTPDNPVLVARDGRIEWVKVRELKRGDFIARVLKLPPVEHIRSIDFMRFIELPDDVKVKLRDEFADEVIKVLSRKFGTLRDAAKKLGVSENLLYSFKKHAHWYYILKRILDEVNLRLTARNIEYVEHRNGSRHRIPEFTPELMYLIGYVLGDGTVYVDEEEHKGYFRISTKSTEVLEYLRDLITKLFGKEPSIRIDERTGVYDLRFESYVIAKALLKIGCQKPKSKAFIHPDLTALGDEYVSKLLAGLFDSDGSYVIRECKGKVRVHIEFYTTSKDLAYKVHLLLLRLGIFSRIREREPSRPSTLRGRVIEGKRKRYVVTISDAISIKRFVEKIGSPLPGKCEKLRKLAELASERLKDNIPSILVRNVLRKYLSAGDCENAIKNRTVSKEWLKRVLDKIPEGPDREYLAKLLNSDIFWDEVKEVNLVKGRYVVYDLTVPECHNFIANAIVTHNTAAVVRDKATGEYYLEAGALVLADGGVCCIDELEKMESRDRVAIHEAMEQQTISIAKAGIVATLNARCAILAAANPAYGRYLPNRTLAENIDLPVTILSRFDLIFIIRDEPEQSRDSALARHITMLHQGATPEEFRDIIPPDLLRKYIAYARKYVKPKLSPEAARRIEQFFLELRRQSQGPNSPIAITARQLEALIRLAEAEARMALRPIVTLEDAEAAIRLMMEFLKSAGLDLTSGALDIDIVMAGRPRSQQEKLARLMDLIKSMEEERGKVKVSELIKRAEEEGIDREFVEKAIETLKRQGELYEPKPGYIKRVKV